MALTAGARLGPYEVQAPLGEGGMGEVYRARDTRLDRLVALKVLSGALTSDASSRERFEREARAISALSHPNICALFDVGEWTPSDHSHQPSAISPDAVPYLVMEYLEGETLAARLARAPMSIAESLAIAIQVARALDRAHRQGIVHRDLKPGNVMLTKSAVKLLDFGLARLVGSDSPDGGKPVVVSVADLTAPTMASPLTMKGTILGTLHYMSPEQVRGDEVDARADVFAFGAMLYEMLSGRRPFEGRSQASVIGAILDADPAPLESVQPATPPLLAELVTRCLAKDSDDRWQSSRDLLRQLEWVASHAESDNVAAAGAAPRVWSKAGIVGVAAALAAAAAIGAGAFRFLSPASASSTQPPARFDIELPEGQAFTRGGRRVLTLSPDGTRLVYVADRQLYLRTLNELKATPIPGTAATDPSSPLVSPDGQWVVFWTAETLKKIPIAGGTPVALASVNNPNGASWIGDRIFLGQGVPRGIVEVPASGGAAKLVVAVDQAKDEIAEGPQLVAGGRAMLFTLRSGQQVWDDASIVVQDLASGARTTLVQGGTDGRLLPTGHLVYARGATLYAVLVNMQTLHVSGSPVPIERDVRLADGGFSGAAQTAWSAGGTFAYVPTGAADAQSRSLTWVDRSGHAEPVAGLPERRYQPGSPQMRMSPDGRRVALTILSDSSASSETVRGQDIWIWEIARGTLTRLTFSTRAASPVWSPDSTRVCYGSEQQLLCQAADGTGQAQPMFDVAGPFSFAAIGPMSPDGRGMLLTVRSASRNDTDIGLASMGARLEPRPLVHSPTNDISPSISPDGRWLVYVSEETGTGEVYVRPFPDVDSGRWQISSGGASDPLWSPKGSELYYLDISGSAGSSPIRSLVAVDYRTAPGFSFGKPTSLFKFPSTAARAFAVGADGRFLLNLPAASAGDIVARQHIVVAQNWFEELKNRVAIVR